MIDETQIIELSELSNLDIARRVIDLLNQSKIQRFTILLKRSLRNTDSREFLNTLKLEQIRSNLRSYSGEKVNRTSNFAVMHRDSSFEKENSIELISYYQDCSDNQMAHHLYSQGQYQKALELLLQIKNNYDLLNNQQKSLSEQKDILISIGNCHYQLKNYEESISLYKNVINELTPPEEQFSPSTAKLYNNLGSAYAHLNLQKQSMNAYSLAINIYQQYPQMDTSPLYTNIANIYFKCKMFSIAQNYFIKAISERKTKNPNHRQILFHIYRKLSQTQKEMKKYKESEENLSKAQKMAEHGVGNLVDILKQAAILRQLQQKWEQAIEFYQKLHLIADKCENNEVCRGYIYQKTSEIYFNIGKWNEHKKYIDKALEEYRKSNNVRKVSDLEKKGFRIKK